MAMVASKRRVVGAYVACGWRRVKKRVIEQKTGQNRLVGCRPPAKSTPAIHISETLSSHLPKAVRPTKDSCLSLEHPVRNMRVQP